MKIKYLSELGVMTLLLWLTTACTAGLEYSSDDEGQSSGTEIPVSISPKLSVGQDETLSKLRVIIFSTRNSNPYASKVLISNEVVAVDQDYMTTTYVGYNDIYVIGNEPVDLSNVKEPKDLKGIQMKTETSLDASEFVFYRELLGVNVKSKNEIYLEGKSDPVSKLDVKLQHVVAKLTVDFALSSEILIDETGTGKYLEFKSMELVRIPKHSYLSPEKYTQDDGYSENKSFSLTNNTATQPNRFKWSSGEIYLPEYLLTDNKYRMVLRINGIENGVSHTYTLPVGDGMNPTSSNSTDWDITRNRYYKLKIKAIKGYGEASLDVDAKVEGWSEVSIPVEIPGESFIVLGTQEIDVKSLRFFSYVRFICSDEIKVTLPDILSANQLKHSIEYDDDTHKSGRIGFRRGNWNTGRDQRLYATLTSGKVSKKLALNFFKTEISPLQDKTDWASAMGYPASANTTNVGVYDASLYKKQSPRKGCNAYYVNTVNDPVTGQGCWRLATIAENHANALSSQWCNEEYEGSGEQAYTAGINNYLGNNFKTRAYSYRCVLDIRPPELSDFIVSNTDVKDISKDQAAKVCTDLGTGWRLPTEKETEYVFVYAGTNGLPNNFFADSYWAKKDNTFVVATVSDPDGSETTDALRNQSHAVRCVKSRY